MRRTARHPPPVGNERWFSSTSTTDGRRGARVVRDSDAGNYLERFLAFAVVSMLAVRAYLRLTGYPQIGGGLHIAHMLWGGALMVAAIFVLLAFLGRRARLSASALAGVGFGLFIDELGKFITRDNDYFFRPTFGIIYLIFVALYLIARAIARLRPLSPREYLVNAADMLIDLLENGATPEEEARALGYLDRAGAEAQLADHLRAVIVAAAGRELEWPSPTTRARAALRAWYRRWSGRRRFEWAVGAIIAADGIVTLIFAIGIVAALGEGMLHIDQRSFAALSSLAASAASAVLVLLGAMQLPHSRRAAYRRFKDAILISIFVAQPYHFFEDELGALGGLFLDLILLLVVDHLARVARTARVDTNSVGGGETEPTSRDTR